MLVDGMKGIGEGKRDEMPRNGKREDETKGRQAGSQSVSEDVEGLGWARWETGGGIVACGMAMAMEMGAFFLS